MKKYITPLLLGIICGLVISHFVVTPLLNKPPKYYSEEHENITVGIAVGEEGYYCTFSDVTLEFYEGSVVNIEITDPTLLAFVHSENWDGGYYVYSYTEIQELIETLRKYPELEDLVNTLEHGLLMTEAST
jgi:hypothetical protein